MVTLQLDVHQEWTVTKLLAANNAQNRVVVGQGKWKSPFLDGPARHCYQHPVCFFGIYFLSIVFGIKIQQN